MGSWGVKSYENDEADGALDAGFDRVHGAVYEALMDDRNPLSVDEIHQRLANPATLAAAVLALETSIPGPMVDWDEVERLAFVGVVVRHAELGVIVPEGWREQAIAWLREETIDWDEATLRKLRRDKELKILDRTSDANPGVAK